MSDKITVGITIGTYTLTGTDRNITLVGLPACTINNLAYLYNKTQDLLYYAPVKGLAKATMTNNVIAIDSAFPILGASDELHIQMFLPELAYDTNLDILKIVNLSRPVILSPDVLIDTTNIAAGTNYYPSSDGLIMIGKSPSFQFNLIAGASNTIVTTIEVTDEPDGVTPAKWLDCTKLGVVSGVGTITSGAYAIGGTGYASLSNAASETIQLKFDFDDFSGYRIRVKCITANGGTATNTVYMSCIQKPLEG